MKTTLNTLYDSLSDLLKTVISVCTYHFEQWFWRNKIEPNKTKHFADGFHEGKWEDDLYYDIHGNPYDPKKGIGDKQYDFAEPDIEEDEEILGI
tara:strand:+ start:107 stop:388 length:282 start_codon:yes stop_codon:yes gene_type:complete